MALQKFDWRQHLGACPTNYVDTKADAVSNKDVNCSESRLRTLKIFYNNILTIFLDYSKTSTVHGIKYFSIPKLHWIERLWWIIATTLSVIGCILLSKEVYNKWQKSPIIISFAEKYTRVSDIPFPAVTICPETKIRSSLLNFTDLYDRWYKNGLEHLERDEKHSIHLQRMIAVLQICSDAVNLELKETSKYNLANPNIFKIIAELAPTFNETMVQCKFQNEEKLCSEYFQEVVTEEGLCYTFNSLRLSEIYSDNVHNDLIDTFDRVIQPSTYWTLDNGYAQGNSSDNSTCYPLRVFGSGSRDGLSVTLSLNQGDFHEKCRSRVQGFKVQLHMPGVIPQLSKHFFYIPMQRELLVAVNPQIIRTDDDLKFYKPDIRQCFFSDEKRLEFFKDYSKSNCDFECLTNFTLQKCGCVRFSMPRNNMTSICGIKNIDCCIAAEDELLRKDDMLLGSNEFDDCNCLPSCSSYAFTSDLSHNIIKTKSDLSDNIEVASMKIFFNKKQFISSKRSKLFGHVEILANFGGLLGFFLGVSLLSFVEIIYFFTLRVILVVKTRNNFGGTQVAEKRINFIKQKTLVVKGRHSPLNQMQNPFFIQHRCVSGCTESNSQGFY